jgi:hypothetical protein
MSAELERHALDELVPAWERGLTKIVKLVKKRFRNSELKKGAAPSDRDAREGAFFDGLE